MLMVDPAALRQSKPPVTVSAPFGSAALPPTPHDDRIGALAAPAPAIPIAVSMFRRDICGAVKCRLMMCGPSLALSARRSRRNQGDLDRFLAAGHQIEALLEIGERKLMGADLVHRQHTGLDHVDGGGPAVRPEMCAEHVEFLVVADDAPVDGHVAAENAVFDVATQLA